MHSTSYVSPKLKKKTFKTPFSPLKSLSYKNLHDSPQKKVCMEALLIDVRYAAGSNGAAAGCDYGMQPYSIERGHGDGPILHPSPIQMGLFL